MILRPFAAALAVTSLPCAASAQEAFALSYGGRVASDYVSDGESLSGGRPVLQGYVDVQRGLFYGGAWASSLDDEGNDVELNLILGIRPVFGDLELDLNYTRYVYDHTGDCCGEIIAYAEYPFSEAIYAGGGFSYDPQSNETWFEVLNGVAINDDWSVSGAISTDFGTSDDENVNGNAVSWDLGLVREFGDAYGDLRYYDSTIGAGRLAVAIGVDF